ncbi:NAD(P)/FAD-dependent oxidoreductase [Aeromicrobium sp. Leaf291]|uniref:flavin-containing monooxygenase n=1 Tax=Aeromicrobium sp. Leaf291 TaxID=1736325 RepID=UPI0006FAD2F3|nr:NAD(P)/FAD-dependent oxidoreductase [Aeromicrobium sp. Leaf291]KQP80838.1 4-hydroxyacetophenone monooxygenase [Aeromicrobium sp. Leaf291]RYY51018.1 MAG: NAD(P)/FAD-dependent oxidoreductase [Actinomycetales bacterium]
MTSVGIIGSGFGGIAVAAELLSHGHHDVRLWERGDDIGGVWRDNTYPGAGCDVPSPLYSYSFAVNTQWSKRYALQPEIREYLHRVADEYGITPRVQLGREVVSAHWQQDEQAWDVGFADGVVERVDVLVSAVGQLSEPRLPALPGLEDFAGDWFHSARWDHDVDLAGKRVAAVGVGASAIQYVPHVAEDAAHLTLFQRSANYILPKPDGPLPRWWRPGIRLERPLWWTFGEQFSRGLDEGSLVGKVEQKAALAHLRRQVQDPRLRELLTPDYPIGCKRILFSNNFYPTLERDHVDVVADRIVRVLPQGVETADGTVHEVDVIVYGTGFDSQDFLSSIDVRGAGGEPLAERWTDGAHAHLGMYVPGFPNLFVSYGPNTNLGGGSIIYMLEAQARHMRQVLDRMEAGGYEAVDVRPEVEAEYDQQVQERLESSVWGSCDSWYRHPSGRITSNWPGSTYPYHRRVRTVEPEDFAWT